MTKIVIVLAYSSLLGGGQTGSMNVAHRAIGFVASEGEFQLDGNRANGNGTLLNGTTVDNLKNPSHLSLTTGSRVDLAPQTRASVFTDHLSLYTGVVQVRPASNFTVIAGGLKFGSEDAGSVFCVEVKDLKFRVLARSGVASVRSPTGVLVARLQPGRQLELARDSDALGKARVVGCLERDGTHYVLRDEATQVVVEVKGLQLQCHVGSRVDIHGVNKPGAKLMPGTSELIEDPSLRILQENACPPGADAWALPTTSSPGTWQYVALLGGVAAASLIGELYANGIFSGGNSAGISTGK